MNLAPVFLNDSNLLKTCKNQTEVEKRIPTISVSYLLKYK